MLLLWRGSRRRPRRKSLSRSLGGSLSRSLGRLLRWLRRRLLHRLLGLLRFSGFRSPLGLLFSLLKQLVPPILGIRVPVLSATIIPLRCKPLIVGVCLYSVLWSGTITFPLFSYYLDSANAVMGNHLSVLRVAYSVWPDPMFIRGIVKLHIDSWIGSSDCIVDISHLRSTSSPRPSAIGV